MPSDPTSMPDNPYGDHIDAAAEAIARVLFGPNTLLTDEAYAEGIAQEAARPLTRELAAAALAAAESPTAAAYRRRAERAEEALLRVRDDARDYLAAVRIASEALPDGV